MQDSGFRVQGSDGRRRCGTARPCLCPVPLNPDAAPPTPFRRRRARAFTLIEMLMVCAILAIVTAITIPSLVKSIRGNRLRAASRTVVQMGRYARSMAVLRQEDMALTFDLQAGQLTVAPAGRATAAVPSASGVESDAEPEPVRLEPSWNTPEEAHAADVRHEGLGGAEPVTRRLDQVAIESVATGPEDEDVETVREGSCVLIYAGSGRCRPYTVVIRDEYGAAVRIAVDALASATTETFETGAAGP